MTEQQAAVAEPEQDSEVRKRPRTKDRPKRQPRYHVILVDDDDHTYDYVIRMLGDLFHHPREKAFQMAKEVDTTGRVIVLTTTREHAELKRDQIHAYGRDNLLERCKGSMRATVEPAPE